jgi:hypothetical protein
MYHRTALADWAREAAPRVAEGVRGAGSGDLEEAVTGALPTQLWEEQSAVDYALHDAILDDMKTYRLLVVNEADPNDVALARSGIPEAALDSIRDKLPLLDGWILAAKRKATPSTSAFAGLFGRKP